MSNEQQPPAVQGDGEDAFGTVEENLGEPEEDFDEGDYQDQPNRTMPDPTITGPVTVRGTIVIPADGDDE